MIKGQLGTLLTVLFTLSLMHLTGCTNTPNPYGDSYGSAETRTVQQVYYGTIIETKPVTIDASSGTNMVGTVAGAAVGGVLGSTIGGGTGSALATIGGGLLGGYAGGKAANAMGERNGVNLTVRLDNGEVISIVQEVDPNMIFRVGEKVQVNMSGNTGRVVPR
ncbi:glycine zipper 2TM domain-containing protein [uncultured Shewanella sp.]|uniref:glycine zipper 2TM domain-containing protein n=1 Tax=uncultured Shewanella sp. TaxID=173975 RepID=UPI00260BB311|nr:glycine zipper 2TM domain-containing protein [uncultured Shewanella sp.]